MLRRVLIPTIVLALTVTADPSSAGPLARTHDGFFLRLSAGVGAANSKLEDNVDRLEVSGGVADLNIAIGGMVADDLALHGTLFGWSAQDPDAELSGTLNVSGTIPGSFTVGGVGVGLTKYFMPTNLYISGTIGVASIELDLDGLPSLESGNGIAADFTIGKEWWTGDNWGLGIAGGLQLHSIGEKGTSENWSGQSVSLRFTATYN